MGSTLSDTALQGRSKLGHGYSPSGPCYGAGRMGASEIPHLIQFPDRGPNLRDRRHCVPPSPLLKP